MRFKAIFCQVFTREMQAVIARSPHSIDADVQPMGLHDLGVGMRPHLQARIDAADGGGYDAILLGYALCGRGTEGLRAGSTPCVLPRAHDCIGILMGSRQAYQNWFERHFASYYRSPGWVEFSSSRSLQPASASSRNALDRLSLDELVEQFGDDDGAYLFEQFSAYRRKYSGLTYISTAVDGEEPLRRRARAEAECEKWTFEEFPGSLHFLERLVNGDWDPADFLVIPPGRTIRATNNDSIVDSA
jgi:hypothetical protein